MFFLLHSKTLLVTADDVTKKEASVIKYHKFIVLFSKPEEDSNLLVPLFSIIVFRTEEFFFHIGEFKRPGFLLFE